MFILYTFKKKMSEKFSPKKFFKRGHIIKNLIYFSQE